MNVSVDESHDTPGRVLAFEGGCNFRDVGGYLSQDGRTVRWGHVYRTGVLSYFTEADQNALRALGVRAICDLRRSGERKHEPTHWPGEGELPRTLHWADEAGMPTLRRFVAGRPETAAGMFDAMMDLYRALPVWLGNRIRDMFECIANEDVPVIIHCAAGKDRTGVSVAILLGVLGVPRETIFEDYLLTNQVADFETFIRTRHDAQLGVTDFHHPLLNVPETMRRVLFSADASFLETALQEIDRAHGGLEAYLERVAGVTPAIQERLREVLLETR